MDDTRCGSCGNEVAAAAKFCSECGTPLARVTRSAEYKQVTVLFADVVHSMDIARAVGAERLHAIMAELATGCATVVTGYGGTVDKFTGDGIMAVFGAPATLEDHATRACLAALKIQDGIRPLADDINRRDGVELQLRVGLNSGQVIAGEIGSGTFGYTSIGEQVGMAQRMESVAPPGGVMVSASTARLVENVALLGELEIVQIKGAAEGVPARRLLGMGNQHRAIRRAASTLVGRRWEMSTVEGLLDRAIAGHGGVVGIMGQAGIGKSRLVRDVSTTAAQRGVELFTSACESHASNIPFYTVARFVREITGVGDLDGDAARTQVRAALPLADEQDLLLLDELLGIRESAAPLPLIAPDARRRRIIAMINAALRARRQPGMFVIEDAHWIDEVSESMVVELLAAIAQTSSLVVITYRPEYRGALARAANFQQVNLAPLNASQTDLLVAQLLGVDASVGGLRALVAQRAAGNPFFVEEMVRDLTERDVVQGHPGAYLLRGRFTDAAVPATLQATIGARIDRLGATAKKTLNAAAVIGTRFAPALLNRLIDSLELEALTVGEFVSEIPSSGSGDYSFCHPLIRTVAYESQLKSDRVQLHRLLAAHLEGPDSADENASVIAGHLESAGDFSTAFAWYMRAGAWYNHRDVLAARTSWRRARHVADQLAEDAPHHMPMRIAPRTLLCGTAFRVESGLAENGFDELTQLCTAIGDQRSLAIGTAGRVLAQNFAGRCREASRTATELIELMESIGDPNLTLALTFSAIIAKHETAEMAEVLRLSQRIIDLADGDATKGNVILGSPLTFGIVLRGVARWCLGAAGWRDDLDQGASMAKSSYPTMLSGMMWRKYVFAIPYGVLLPDATALRDTAETLATAEQSGDDLALDLARTARGVTLVHQGGQQREDGLALLTTTRERAKNAHFAQTALPIVDLHIAMAELRLGDVDGAIESARTVVADVRESGAEIWSAFSTSVLVEALVKRSEEADLDEAQAAVDRLAAEPTAREFVVHETSVLRLRALLAGTRGDQAVYREYRDRYRSLATKLGFEGQKRWAEAMP
ncbi:adenylate/guanylate cyclase domain-containing protein [Mycolicibacterium tusciae]|uniref:adenylate/guanylate cyclase domain-containing protein n=1 Tax=Mycolicibacterium tusciae TaxID=75922 RepID=UPI0002D2E177|nr:adenylate/guanylate cyclase domain-containing protein [Mycolicibacterium tusciae]